MSLIVGTILWTRLLPHSASKHDLGRGMLNQSIADPGLTRSSCSLSWAFPLAADADEDGFGVGADADEDEDSTPGNNRLIDDDGCGAELHDVGRLGIAGGKDAEDEVTHDAVAGGAGNGGVLNRGDGPREDAVGSVVRYSGGMWP